MHRLGVLAWTIAFWLGATPIVRAQADPLPVKIDALEKHTQRVIAESAPSIACILVSRSDAYAKVGQPPGPDGSGRLDGFEPGLLTVPQKRNFLARLDLADPAHVPESYGSGVVVDEEGLILTHFHVVRDATKVFVRLPGNKGSYANIHAADARADLAVLKLIDRRALPLKPLPLGDASRIERGHFVISLANPFAAGFRDGQPSASWGMISNVRRRAPTPPREEERTKPLYHYGILLQTDARLHLGSSGGALLNLQGELVGLTTALAAIQGGETPGGFAMPIEPAIRRIIDVLKRGEEVDYGFLGVSFEERIPKVGQGVALKFVTSGSPAEKEGKLRPGDAILSVNGFRIEHSDDLFLHLGTQLAGSKVKIEVRRAGAREPQIVEVTLAKFHATGRKIASSLGKRPFVRGLRVDYASLVVQQPLLVMRIPPGVLVSDVQPNSEAAAAQLKVGEIITHVNDRAVHTPQEFYQAMAEAKGPIELLLYNFAPQEPPSRIVLK